MRSGASGGRREVSEMVTVIMVITVWTVAIIGIRVMKKIQPNDRIYPVWAVIICVLLTIVVGWSESWGPKILALLAL